MKITVPQKCYDDLKEAHKRAHVILTVGPEHERLSLYKLTATINEDNETQQYVSDIRVGTPDDMFKDLEDFGKDWCTSQDGDDYEIESISVDVIISNIFNIGLAYIGPNDKGYGEPGENKYNRICDEPGCGIHLTVSKA